MFVFCVVIIAWQGGGDNYSHRCYNSINNDRTDTRTYSVMVKDLLMFQTFSIQPISGSKAPFCIVIRPDKVYRQSFSKIHAGRRSLYL